MRAISYIFAAGLILALFGVASCQTTANRPRLPAGVTPIQATWIYGRHVLSYRITENGYNAHYNGSPLRDGTWQEFVERSVRPGAVAPAVIWLHGCQGQTSQTDHAVRIFALMGFSVFAPDSFADPSRAAMCGGSDIRSRIALRHRELRYALDQIQGLPWVDRGRIVFAGFSEGGHSVAAYGGKDFVAHVLIGTDCNVNDGQPSAPVGVPFINMVGVDDSYGYGSGCGLSPAKRGDGSRVVRVAGGHGILQNPDVEKQLVAFLQRWAGE